MERRPGVTEEDRPARLTHCQMTPPLEYRRPLTRRQFLRRGVVSLGSATLAATTPRAIHGGEEKEAVNPPSREWQLTFADEFDGAKVDLSRWNLNDPWGRERNRELQAYVPDAFSLNKGVLRIKAERGEATYDGKRRSFRSGMMTTQGKFRQQFGRFEISCRVPRGRGLWPAFWLLPDPPAWPPEIDVFEILGHEPTVVHLSHHWRDADGRRHSDSKRWHGPDFSSAFHTFAAEWTPADIRWYVDGVEHQRSTKSIPQTPMCLLVNLAVGGNWPGAPDETTPFPAHLEVDYVRAYRLKSRSE